MTDNFKVCILNPDNTIGETIIFSDKLIHLDDTIQTIKNKIILKLGLDRVSYNELYLFAYFMIEPISDTNLLDIYNGLIGDDEELSGDKLKHFYNNYTTEPIDFTDRLYTFENIRELFSKIQTRKYALGRKFTNSINHLFSVNPFQSTTAFVKEDTQLYSSDTSVLLHTGGQLKDNIIYVCLAKDVLGRSDVIPKYIIDSYYPSLSANGINGLSDLIGRSQELISETKQTFL